MYSSVSLLLSPIESEMFSQSLVVLELVSHRLRATQEGRHSIASMWVTQSRTYLPLSRLRGFLLLCKISKPPNSTPHEDSAQDSLPIESLRPMEQEKRSLSDDRLVRCSDLVLVEHLKL